MHVPGLGTADVCVLRSWRARYVAAQVHYRGIGKVQPYGSHLKCNCDNYSKCSHGNHLKCNHDNYLKCSHDNNFKCSHGNYFKYIAL